VEAVVAGRHHSGLSREESMKIQLEAEAMLIKGRDMAVSVAQHQGRTEVVVRGNQESVRVLNDAEGLHVGRKKPVSQ